MESAYFFMDSHCHRIHYIVRYDFVVAWANAILLALITVALMTGHYLRQYRIRKRMFSFLMLQRKQEKTKKIKKKYLTTDLTDGV